MRKAPAVPPPGLVGVVAPARVVLRELLWDPRGLATGTLLLVAVLWGRPAGVLPEVPDAGGEGLHLG